MDNSLTTVSNVQMFPTVIQTRMKTVTVNNTEFSFSCNETSEKNSEITSGISVKVDCFVTTH